jgi:hypothetical protein
MRSIPTLKNSCFVRFEVFTAVTMKNAVFSDVVVCSSWVNRRFGGTYRLHIKDRTISERGTRVSRWLQTEPPVENTQLYRNKWREREWATCEINIFYLRYLCFRLRNVIHHPTLHNLYSSPNIITMTKSRRITWAEHVVRMEEEYI